MKTIKHTVDIAASPEEVFDALTHRSGLAGWWTVTVEKAPREVGGTVRFRFGATFNPDMEITALEAPTHLSWRCVGGHEPWQDNTFDFRVENRDSGCALFFTQVYARELSDEAYGRYAFNWAYYLESLRRLVETGRGTPYGGETAEDRKAVVERFVEEYKNQHNIDIVDELVHKECKIHIPLPGLPQGREGMRVNGRLVTDAFPDVHVKREFLLADGDVVFERALARATHQGELMGIPPDGTPVSWTELHAYRVEDGLITEVWSEPDLLGIMGQLGVVELPGGERLEGTSTARGAS